MCEHQLVDALRTAKLGFLFSGGVVLFFIIHLTVWEKSRSSIVYLDKNAGMVSLQPN